MNPTILKECVVERVPINPEELTQSMLREADCLDRVMALPKDLRTRLAYLANTLAQVATREQDQALKITVGVLAQSLCYIMNSASWSEGELKDFDLLEIQRKLDSILRLNINQTVLKE